MEKRTPNVRPTATQTNGAPARVYVKYWRSEPVGLVKKALKQDIPEWIQDQDRANGEMVKEDAWPDLDAVRHANQFGTPEEPMM